MLINENFKQLDKYFDKKVDNSKSRCKILSQIHDHFEKFNIINPICAEIGVFRGEFSNKIIKYINPQHLYLVDIWEPYNDHSELCQQSTEYFNYVYNYICKNFNNDKYSIIKNTSIEASKTLLDNSLDFIYIDANHDDCYNDLLHWYPKLKRGGIIAGHDYYGNVKNDVCKFFYKQHKIINSIIKQWYFIKV